MKELSANVKNSWWTKKRIVAVSVATAAVIAFAVFLVFVFVFELGPVRPIESTEEEAAAVGECGGYEVRYEELRYITAMNRATLDEKYGKYDTLDAQTQEIYREELRSGVLDDIKSNYVVLSLCEEYGIDVNSSEAKEYVNDKIQDLVEEERLNGSVREYKKWLADNGLTDAFLRLLYRVDYLEGELLDKFVEDKIGIEYDNKNKAEFVDYVMNGGEYVKTIHAFYPFEHPTGKVGYNAAKNASDALERLTMIVNDGERYSLMKSEIGRAPFVQGFSVTGSDFYFTYGQMDERYETVAFSLDIYEVGEIVMTEDGYYVIMRVPMDRDEIGLRVSDLLLQYQYAVLKRACDIQKGEISFVGNEYFNSLDLVLIK